MFFVLLFEVEKEALVRQQLEKEINDLLYDMSIARTMGGAVGVYYSYIDVAVFDIDGFKIALEKINESRATLGAQQNRLEYASSNLTTSTENLSSAESRIRDVDVAKEMVKLSKLNILNQASQAMVSQAKQQPESVSQLLR